MTRSRKSRKVAKGVGIIALIAFLIGMYTGLPGFGGGSGVKGDATVGDPKSGGPVKDADPDTKAGLEQDVVTVLIEQRQYSVLTRKDTEEHYQAATISEILNRVEQAKGDENGVRVKVLRKESSRVSAEEALRSALTKAGVTEAAIYWPTQLMP